MTQFVCQFQLNSRLASSLPRASLPVSPLRGPADCPTAHFDQVKTIGKNPESEPFCQYLVHLFSQLSALATMALHVNKAGLAASDKGVNVDLLRRAM